VTQTAVDPELIRRNIAKLREIRDRRGSATPRIVVKMFESYGEENEVFKQAYAGVADEIDFENVNDATLYNDTNLVAAFYKDQEHERRTRANFQASLNRHVACPRPFMALVVCSNGAVLMCTHDYPRATKVGDLNVSTIRQVWESRELFAFRKMMLEGRKHENLLCRNCVWFKLFPETDCVDGLAPELFLPPGGFSP
jgi:radical SAM protein with 4Fe4S-binding SPASM domain